MILISTYTKQAFTIVMITFALLAAFPFIKIHYGNQLTFSAEPGFYDSPFYLSILGGGKNTIHYTLDGSEPTVNDPVFDRNSPLYIEDATKQPNVYSMRTDTSTGFLTDLIIKYAGADIPNYTVPDFLIDKCTVIRASLFDSTGNCLNSITGTYFVGFQNKSGYQNIYIASIITSPENLFDNDTGIYVTGHTFQQFCTENPNLIEGDGSWAIWGANYFNRGMKAERAAHITIFDTHQNIALSQKCGIRIKGNASRSLLPRSIGCYARTVYNDNANFNSDILQAGIFPHKIVFFSGGQDCQFNLKDYLVNVMAQDLHFSTLDFIPCAMFLDGEYWGMYWLTEDYNADYISDHYRVAPNNIIMVKTGNIVEGTTAEDSKEYEEMRSYIIEHDMSNTINYNHAHNFIDIDSFIDYYVTMIYIARCIDWPNNNFALWRTRENDGSPYGDNKWRWMIFDVNSPSLDLIYLYNNTLSNVLAVDPVFASLYQNEEFRRKFAERLLYIGKEVFAPEKCNLFIDQYVQTMREPLAASNMRFYMDDKSEEFEQYVADMRTFFEQRYDVVWDFMVQDMGEEWLAENGIQK